MSNKVVLDGVSLTSLDLERVAYGAEVELGFEVRNRMQANFKAFSKNGENQILQEKGGWLTGGVHWKDSADLIRHFIEGHCAAVGPELSREAVRATLAARVNVLATGFTGCRPVCAEILVRMLNDDVIPIVPSFGSVGAAGNPILAHIMRVACNYGGEAWSKGRRVPAELAMASVGILVPTQKEALSLINGSSLASAFSALVVARALRALEAMETACAVTFEAVRANTDCLSEEALASRGHPEAPKVARRLKAFFQGSDLVGSDRVADAFSIRCAPAVLGTAWEAILGINTVVGRELNGACDNPLVLDDGQMIEGGNFHGAPVALAMDQLKIALTQVASISERRIFRLTHGQLSGLPSFLVEETGLNNGLMLAQYTAASLVSECKGLSHPASVDSLPIVQNMEDHVSMAPIAARGAYRIVKILEDVAAIELMCACQGLDFRMNHIGSLSPETEAGHPGEGTRKVFDMVRTVVPVWTQDRVLHTDLKAVGDLVRAGAFSKKDS